MTQTIVIVIDIALLGVGLAYVFYTWKFDRAALDGEPGDPAAFSEHRA